MKRLAGSLLCLAVAILILGPGWAANAEETFWYKGLFDGEAKTTGQGWGLYEYTPTPGLAYLRHQPRHSRITRSWSFGPFRYCETKEVINSEDEPEGDKIYTRYPLPGQYWYEKPQSYSLTRGRSLPPLVRYDRER